jgi:hypothetical protein
VDFVSDVGAKVVRSQFVRKSQKPSIIISWGTKAGAKILDALFLSQFELQRADYWLTMLQSVVICKFHLNHPHTQIVE